MNFTHANVIHGLKEVFDDDARSFMERRDEIVRQIKAAPFYNENDFALSGIVMHMGDSDDADDFDWMWELFTDWADAQRICESA